MLTIGSFSKICMVTAKTLRHYDRMDLLKPAHLDSFTGYRYYDITQLKDMMFIQKLKEYGFALKEIKVLLGPGRINLKESMENKYMQIAAQMEEQKSLLAKMHKDILDLQKGMNIMKDEAMEIKIIETTETPIVSVREMTSISNFGVLMGKAYELLQKTGAACLGAPFAIYHSPDYNPEETDLEIGFPVSPKSGYTRVLKGSTCVLGIHKGEYSRLHETYVQIAEWIEQHGYTISDSPYERYLNDPGEVPPEDLLTEVYFPVKK